MKAGLTAAMLFAALLFSSPVFSQTPRATIYITVKNATGDTRKGLEVSLTDKKTPPGVIRTFTDDKGRAEFNVARSIAYPIKVDGKPYGTT
jgi:hypothetical protein